MRPTKPALTRPHDPPLDGHARVKHEPESLTVTATREPLE
jgi:hypothetical protein